jgi:hypothetical protein
MNIDKLLANNEFLDTVQSNKKAGDAWAALIEELTIVIQDGEGPAAKLAELAPLLVGLQAQGADPVIAVELAIVAASARAATN